MISIQPQVDPIRGIASDRVCHPARCKGLGAELGSTEQAPGLTRRECGERAHWQVTANHLIRYVVELVPRLLDPSNPVLARSGSSESQSSQRRLLVIDAEVHSLYAEQLHRYLRAQQLEYELEVIEAEEPAKTMDGVFGVVGAMERFGISRRSDPIIAVGGGVLTDIVGLAANLYRRSTPYVRVPTTLMGMIDAGIGVKTGVNFLKHKNRLGTYYAPAATLIDPTFLQTCSPRHIRNGLAEALKMALVKDAILFEQLEQHGRRLVEERLQAANSTDAGAGAYQLLTRSINGMLEELQPNLWEHRLDRRVDYGHSFSPAIEMHALPELLHGEAVAIDMAISLALAHGRGLLTAAQMRRVLAVMHDLELPLWHPVCTPELLGRALADTVKHRNGQQLLPLTCGIGDVCFVNDITAAEIAAALGYVAQVSKTHAVSQGEESHA